MTVPKPQQQTPDEEESQLLSELQIDTSQLAPFQKTIISRKIKTLIKLRKENEKLSSDIDSVNKNMQENHKIEGDVFLKIIDGNKISITKIIKGIQL